MRDQRPRRRPGGNLPIIHERVKQSLAARAAQSDTPPYQQQLESCRARIGKTYTQAQLERPTTGEKQDILALIREAIGRFNQQAESSGQPQLEEALDGLAQQMMDSILGLGSLEPLLADPSIEDIYINGPDEVLVVSEGELQLRQTRFESGQHLMDVINRAVAGSGRRLDFSSPIVDAQLPDGSRLNAVISPIAAERGPYVTIRRHRLVATTMDDLLRLETITPDAARFLEAAVKSYTSLLVSGATATGKTNTINCLSSFFDPTEPKLVIEDTRELQLKGQNVRYLVTRPPSVEGTGEITQAQLGKAALRMRPRRIIFGEVRDAEAWDMVNMGNTGHDGLIAGVHANSPRDAVDRLVNLCRRAVDNIPEEVIVREVVRAITLVVHLRFDPGTNKRHVVDIAEISGNMEGITPAMQSLFKWQGGQLRYQGGRAQKRLHQRLQTYGFDVDELFSGPQASGQHLGSVP